MIRTRRGIVIIILALAAAVMTAFGIDSPPTDSAPAESVVDGAADPAVGISVTLASPEHR